MNCKLSVNGTAIINENGGCGVYAKGTHFSNGTIVLNTLSAGKRGDSPLGTDSSLVCPFIGGNQASNGVNNDGMGQSSDIGYFGPSHNEILIGAVFDHPTGDSGATSPVPEVGDTIRIRDAGMYNKIRIKYADYASSLNNLLPIATATVIGENNYNGGVGGAPYAKAVYCSSALANLNPGASVNHHMYHQNLTYKHKKPIGIVWNNEGAQNNGIVAIAHQDLSYNRHVYIRFKNTSDIQFSGSVFYWLIFD